MAKKIGLTIRGVHTFQLSAKRIRKLSNTLDYKAFDWNSTPQGGEYWSDVRNNLLAVAEMVDLQNIKDMIKKS